MKITIDSDNKTIQVHNTVSIKDVKKYLKEHPELDEYSLVGYELIYTYYPTIPQIYPYVNPLNPTWTSQSATLTTTP